jgi:hypothetical protein
MALIKPEQLRSGLYQISGSFSGSFIGDGSELINLPSPSQIVFNNITASVNVGPNTLSVISSSIEFFTINNQGSTTITSNADDVFLIKNLQGDDILTVDQTGIITLATSSTELTSSAPNGGIYFTSSSFFIGLD